MTSTARSTSARTKSALLQPSIPGPNATPFSLEQDLKPFGTWASDAIWAPPKDASTEMAESMLQQPGWFKSMDKRWDAVVATHRDSFTQVREIELAKASIRLPKGKLFVSVTQQADFDTIADAIPDCVQTRLEEFIAGPRNRYGVKIYYLKPLCVEFGDVLHFTSGEDVSAAIERIRGEVFAEYRRLFFQRRCQQVMRKVADGCLAVPRAIVQRAVQKRIRVVDEYQAKLEFERRKTALRAARVHRKLRTDGCTYDEMLALTNPLQREDVIEQFVVEKQLSSTKKKQLLRIAAGSLPWFVALSIGVGYAATAVAAGIFTAAPPLAVADPAFVAEFPESPGVVLNIGHFDEVAGVRHIEL